MTGLEKEEYLLICLKQLGLPLMIRLFELIENKKIIRSYF